MGANERRLLTNSDIRSQRLMIVSAPDVCFVSLNALNRASCFFISCGFCATSDSSTLMATRVGTLGGGPVPLLKRENASLGEVELKERRELLCCRDSRTE